MADGMKQSRRGKQANSHRSERKRRKYSENLGRRNSQLNKMEQGILNEIKVVERDTFLDAVAPATKAVKLGELQKRLKSVVVKRKKVERLIIAARKG